MNMPLWLSTYTMWIQVTLQLHKWVYLRVEESSHPEDVGSSVEAPGVELGVAVNQLREPETKGHGVPGDLLRRKNYKNIKMKFFFQLKLLITW